MIYLDQAFTSLYGMICSVPVAFAASVAEWPMTLHVSATPLSVVISSMLKITCNLLITAAGFAAAFLAAGSAQAVLDFGAPALSARIVAGTNVSTLVLLVSVAISFFLMAYVASGWMRTKAAVLWLLAPPIALYFVAIPVQPYVYQCYRMPMCWVIQAPFVIGVAAILAGGLTYRLRNPVSRDTRTELR